MTPTGLILIALAGISLVLFLVIAVKLQAFIALILGSLFVGLAAGMTPPDIIDSIQRGMGGTLGYIAIVIGLGAMFGEMLRVSGGAERIALTLLEKMGEDRAQWAFGLAGFIIAIPVFFDVGLIILVPLVYSIAAKAGKSLLYYGIPLLAGLAVTHSFIPPTPGPVTVAVIIGADLGWVILFGFIAGVPAVLLGGIFFGRYIAKKIHLRIPEYMIAEHTEKTYTHDLPSFKLVLSIILLPLILILVNTLSGFILAEENRVLPILQFVGHPFVALTLATLLTFYFLGTLRGYSRADIQRITTKSFEPAGIIILITGAGGIFKETLIDSGVGDAIGEAMAATNLPIIASAFLIAGAVRVAQGGATVAMITAASLIAPVLAMPNMDISAPLLGLIVISIASGATILSHVNDSGFWLVSRFFGMTEKQTLQSWTIMETIIGFVGFGVVLTISFFV